MDGVVAHALRVGLGVTDGAHPSQAEASEQANAEKNFVGVALAAILVVTGVWRAGSESVGDIEHAVEDRNHVAREANNEARRVVPWKLFPAVADGVPWARPERQAPAVALNSRKISTVSRCPVGTGTGGGDLVKGQASEQMR